MKSHEAGLWGRRRRRKFLQPWEISRGRASCDQIREPIKTVEIDTYSTPKTQKPQCLYHQQKQSNSSHSVFASPPLTPSPSKPRNLQIHSASPRCIRVERNPNPNPNPNPSSMPQTPNYMATTASAKARSGYLRSQSAPRQRIPNGHEQREKSSNGSSSARKRLFNNGDPSGNNGNESDTASDLKWRSPRCNINNGNRAIGLLMEKKRESVSSSCTDTEISPPRTSAQLISRRRWLSR